MSQVKVKTQNKKTLGLVNLYRPTKLPGQQQCPIVFLVYWNKVQQSRTKFKLIIFTEALITF